MINEEIEKTIKHNINLLNKTSFDIVLSMQQINISNTNNEITQNFNVWVDKESGKMKIISKVVCDYNHPTDTTLFCNIVHSLDTNQIKKINILGYDKLENTQIRIVRKSIEIYNRKI